MRNILLDENISYQYMLELEKLGYTVLHISDLEPGTSDTHVLHLATKHNAILVTQDSDFGHLIYRDDFDHTLPIIYIRDKTQQKRVMFERLVTILGTVTLDVHTYITVNNL